MPGTASSPQPGRAAFASFVGTTIEWFDFYVYATAAALVFGQYFFPAGTDPLVGLAASFATFAVGFFARPLGGIVFGHFGDRVGRKSALVTTLVMMGAATFCVGLLPGYEAIGTAAPMLLVILRFVQGLAVGGEWGGAVLMAVEHAPAHRKVFFGSFAQLGNPAGALLASGSFSLLAAWDTEALYEWTWRVPFLASALLVAIGLMVRLTVTESPVFTAAVVDGPAPIGSPLSEAFRTARRSMLFGLLSLPISVGGYYIITTFLQGYASTELAVDETVLLAALSVAAFVELVATPLVSWLGDRFGGRRVVTLGLAGVAVLAVPQFLVLGWGDVAVFASLAVMRLALAATYGPMAGVMAEMFPARVRYTGVSMSYQVAGALFGGLAPLACTGLAAWAGNALPVGLLLVVLAAVSAVALNRAPRYRDTPAAAPSSAT